MCASHSLLPVSFAFLRFARVLIVLCCWTWAWGNNTQTCSKLLLRVLPRLCHASSTLVVRQCSCPTLQDTPTKGHFVCQMLVICKCQTAVEHILHAWRRDEESERERERKRDVVWVWKTNRENTTLLISGKEVRLCRSRAGELASFLVPTASQSSKCAFNLNPHIFERERDSDSELNQEKWQAVSRNFVSFQMNFLQQPKLWDIFWSCLGFWMRL